MSVAVAHLEGFAGPFTVDDLDDFPEIGLRFELIEGTLLVSAAPSLLHQLMCARLYDALAAACPPELIAMPGPAEVRKGDHTSMQPDVLVVRRTDIDLAREDVPPPLLVIEVASPSTRMIDQGSKRLAYRAAGVGAYWLADPFTPSVTVIRWDGDDETEAHVAGDALLHVDWPAPLDLRPSELVAT